MMYALVNFERTQILKIGYRPDWFTDDGPVNDEVLAAGGLDGEERDGWVPIIEEPFDIDLNNQELFWLPEKDWVIEQDRVIKTHRIENKDIIQIKDLAAVEVDGLAEGVRSVFLTQGGSGQALEYDQTRREAEEWLDASDPDIDDFPMLRAEYNARRIAEPSITAQQVVDDTMSEIAIWKLVGSAIKEIRRTAKVAIEVAETRERVKQIRDWAGAAFYSAGMTGQFEPLPVTAPTGL